MRSVRSVTLQGQAGLAHGVEGGVSVDVGEDLLQAGVLAQKLGDATVVFLKSNFLHLICL